LNSRTALELGYPYLADWLGKVEPLWDCHNTGSMSLIQQLDHYGKLSSQFPIKTIRVVYTKAGINLTAAIIRDRESLIDHKLFWVEPRTLDEAYYLTAILNSEAVRARVENLQSEGEFGKRDFNKAIFSLPIPTYSNTNHLHKELASQAKRAERIASGVVVPGSFRAARKAIRTALTLAGVAQAIDRLVDQLLSAALRAA
jgi:hypothetical protein